MAPALSSSPHTADDVRARPLAVAVVVTAATCVAAITAPRGGQGTVFALGAESGKEHEAARLIGSATCGVERWPVKTLTDADKGRVSFALHSAKIGYLGALAPTPGGQSTRGHLETRTYGVTGVLTKVKRETDSDYHLVLRSAGKSMIAEMPFVGCDAGARNRTHITGARTALETALGGPVGTSWSYPNLRVRVTGVLFFDFAHGQSGHAANYVELHPVIGFRRLS